MLWKRPKTTFTGLQLFFAFGATMCFLTVMLLVFSGN